MFIGFEVHAISLEVEGIGTFIDVTLCGVVEGFEVGVLSSVAI